MPTRREADGLKGDVRTTTIAHTASAASATTAGAARAALQTCTAACTSVLADISARSCYCMAASSRFDERGHVLRGNGSERRRDETALRQRDEQRMPLFCQQCAQSASRARRTGALFHRPNALPHNGADGPSLRQTKCMTLACRVAPRKAAQIDCELVNSARRDAVAVRCDKEHEHRARRRLRARLFELPLCQRQRQRHRRAQRLWLQRQRALRQHAEQQHAPAPRLKPRLRERVFTHPDAVRPAGACRRDAPAADTVRASPHVRAAPPCDYGCSQPGRHAEQTFQCGRARHG
eukprot:5048511-Pleurochrysis_carterae.AAC.3